MNAWVGAAVPDDTSYRSALQRRTELAEQLRLVNEYIALYEKLFLGGEQPSNAPERTEAGRRRQRNVMSPRQLANLARDILVEAGRPMTRSDLASAIESRGIPLAGADKSKNLGTILWRFNKEFVNLPGLGYWLRDLPNGAVGYDPDVDRLI